MEQPRNHESTKSHVEKRVFVLSCFRGLLAAAILVGASTFSSAADPVASMIERAVQIQVSLAKDKMDGVAANAVAIATDAAALGKDGEKIAAGALALQKAPKIADARTAFGQMSEALIGYLDARTTKPGNGVRVAYCPMIRKPWLQKDGAIQNPYYGASMLTCGSFKP
jgi:hypothetical protein